MAPKHIRFEFVKALPTDAVIDLYKAGGWWKETGKSGAEIPAMIKGSFCFLAAFHEEKLIGMGRVISDGISDGYIQDVVVNKEYRNQGIGKELVRRLTEYCSEKKLAWIALWAEPGTAEFYESIGFRTLDFTPMLFQKELL